MVLIKKSIYFICFISAQRGLLFGYDWVAIGGAKPFYEVFFGITDNPVQQGRAVSIAIAGCLAGATAAGRLAFRALGMKDKTCGYFNKLADYGRQHYHDKAKMDYFAVSLPDLLIWNDPLDTCNCVHCLFMLTLGHAGLGNIERSKKSLSEAAALGSRLDC